MKYLSSFIEYMNCRRKHPQIAYNFVPDFQEKQTDFQKHFIPWMRNISEIKYTDENRRDKANVEASVEEAKAATKGKKMRESKRKSRLNERCLLYCKYKSVAVFFLYTLWILKETFCTAILSDPKKKQKSFKSATLKIGLFKSWPIVTWLHFTLLSIRPTQFGCLSSCVNYLSKIKFYSR